MEPFSVYLYIFYIILFYIHPFAKVLRYLLAVASPIFAMSVARCRSYVVAD